MDDVIAFENAARHRMITLGVLYSLAKDLLTKEKVNDTKGILKYVRDTLDAYAKLDLNYSKEEINFLWIIAGQTELLYFFVRECWLNPSLQFIEALDDCVETTSTMFEIITEQLYNLAN